MKKSLMKQLIPAFLCLILLLTGSCKSQTESPKQSGEPVTTEPATDDAADTLVLAKDGASGYVIVYDEADSGARSLAAICLPKTTRFRFGGWDCTPWYSST